MNVFICQHCGHEYDDTTVCTADDCPGNEIVMPALVEVWSVDSLAECLDGVGESLYAKLWSFVPADGETPKGKDVWNELTDDEKRELLEAISQEYPDLI